MKIGSSIKVWGVLLLAGLLSTGCSYNIPKYGASSKNINKMKNIKTKINIGEFTSKEKGQSSITCRGAGGVGTPNKTPFEKYIKNALVSELKLAGKYNPRSKITIKGHLEKIDFNSNIGTADWLFTLKVNSNKSKGIIVKSKYEFPGSFIADKACSEVAQAFIPAVQKLISDVVKHPRFTKLF